MNRRRLRFADYAAVLADAETLVSGGYQRVGNWSLGQMAIHLAIIAEGARKGFPWYLPWPFYLPIRWFALPGVLRGEPIKTRLPGPAFAQPPDDADDRTGVERLRTALVALDAPDNRFFPHPVFGSLTRDQWRQLTIWHCEHHLSFLLPQ